MHEYRFQASEDAVETLRKLRGAWAAMFVSESAVEVRLADGSGVRIVIEAADVEDKFEAFKLHAFADAVADIGMEDVSAFAEGGNDVVLFTGVTWSEPGADLASADAVAALAPRAVAPGAVMHFSGHPGQLSETADVVCITTDAFVVANPRGVGLLVRTGLKPYSVQVIRDRATISEFLFERGYQSE